MKKYDVFLYNAYNFEGIEANSEEEARHIALERWVQCIPSIIVHKNETDSDIEDEE